MVTEIFVQRGDSLPTDLHRSQSAVGLSFLPPRCTVSEVKDIILDAASWQATEDFYRAYVRAVGAPEWHGHNLDALCDSLVGGDINQRNPPFHIRVIGTESLAPELRRLLERLTTLVSEARTAGQAVSIEVLP